MGRTPHADPSRPSPPPCPRGQEVEVRLGHQLRGQGVLDEPRLAAGRQPRGVAVQAADAELGQLVADVVELAVELRRRPAEPGRDRAGGRGGPRRRGPGGAGPVRRAPPGAGAGRGSARRVRPSPSRRAASAAVRARRATRSRTSSSYVVGPAVNQTTVRGKTTGSRPPGESQACSPPNSSATVALSRVPTFESHHSPPRSEISRKCRCRKGLSSIETSASRPMTSGTPGRAG